MSSSAVSMLHTESLDWLLTSEGLYLHIIGVGQLFLKRHNGSLHTLVDYFFYTQMNILISMEPDGRISLNIHLIYLAMPPT